MVIFQRLLLMGWIGLASSFLLLEVRAQTATETAPPVGEATPAKKSKGYEDSIKSFEDKDKLQPPPQEAVVFIGSSSVRKWTTLAADFPEIPVINRGFGGSIVEDSVKYADRIVIPYHPRVVVFYAGGNDIERSLTPAQILEQYKAFDDKVFAALPSTTIVHISLNPTTKRANHDKEVRETNRLLAEYAKTNPKIVFIESYSKMVGEDGLARKEWLQSDGVHLNEIGYQKWKEVIKPVLLETCKKAGVAAKS